MQKETMTSQFTTYEGISILKMEFDATRHTQQLDIVAEEDGECKNMTIDFLQKTEFQDAALYIYMDDENTPDGVGVHLNLEASKFLVEKIKILIAKSGE